MNSVDIEKYLSRKRTHYSRMSFPEFIVGYAEWWKSIRQKNGNNLNGYSEPNLRKIFNGEIKRKAEGAKLNSLLYFLVYHGSPNFNKSQNVTDADTGRDKQVEQIRGELQKIIDADFEKGQMASDLFQHDSLFVYALFSDDIATEKRFKDESPDGVAGYFQISEEGNVSGSAFLHYPNNKHLAPNGYWFALGDGAHFSKQSGMMYEFELNRNKIGKKSMRGFITFSTPELKIDPVLGKNVFTGSFVDVPEDSEVDQQKNGLAYCESCELTIDELQVKLPELAPALIVRAKMT